MRPGAVVADVIARAVRLELRLEPPALVDVAPHAGKELLSTSPAEATSSGFPLTCGS